MSTAPLLCQYTGDGFGLLGRSKKAADAAYVVGQRYIVEVREERSEASHRHFFASVHEAWLNLNETQAARFPSAEHLRKYALIQMNYRDERVIVCSSNDEALKLSSFVPTLDEFAIATVNGSIVTVAIAKSQSLKSMGRKDFQASKDAVFSYLAWLVDVRPVELAHMGEWA